MKLYNSLLVRETSLYSKARSKLYIVPYVISLWALTTGPRLHRIMYASAFVGAPQGDIMTNNTTMNETTNLTQVKEVETGMLDSLMDMLTSSPELILMGAAMLAMGAYIMYTQPAVKALVMPYIKKYDDEILALLDENLTKAQLAAYKKLDETAQKNVKNTVLRNVIMSAWDEHDDMMAEAVRKNVRAAMTK